MTTRLSARSRLHLVGWWVTLLAIYLAVISTVTLVELGCGLVLATLGTGMAALSRRAFDVPAGPPDRLAQWLALLPREVAAGGWSLTRRLVRPSRVSSQFADVTLAHSGPDDAATRAYAVLALSVSPSTYVVDLDLRADNPDDPGRLVVHRLGASGRLERVIAR